jgi:hypothetical protein
MNSAKTTDDTTGMNSAKTTDDTTGMNSTKTTDDTTGMNSTKTTDDTTGMNHAKTAGKVNAQGELRAFMKAMLPDDMLPSAFVFLAELPLTPNGKVDRKALPAMETRIEGDRYQAPRDACEQQLVVIWESLLARRPVGIEDRIFFFCEAG